MSHVYMCNLSKTRKCASQIGQLKISLKSVSDQWNQYRQAAEEINSNLTEGRYSVSRFRLLTGSLDAVQLQVDSLQVGLLSTPTNNFNVPVYAECTLDGTKNTVKSFLPIYQNLQKELEKQESSLRKFGAITHQLLKECHPSVSDSLNNTLKDVNARWSSLLEEIVERLKSSKALLQLWQSYKDLYEQNNGSIQSLEVKAERLLKMANKKDISEEEVSTWIQDCTVRFSAIGVNISFLPISLLLV